MRFCGLELPLRFRWLGVKLGSVAVVALAAGVAHIGAAGAGETVLPSAQATVEGNSNNCIPVTGCLNVDRYQQVYGGSDFGAIGTVFVTKIAFRPDGQAFPFTEAVLSNVEIRLSTTTAQPDYLSETFAANIGPDETLVYSGPLSLTAGDDTSTPRDFSVVIPLKTPFLYTPGLNQNLLFEFKNVGGSGDGCPMNQLDAEFSGPGAGPGGEDTTPDSVSRIYFIPTVTGCVTGPGGDMSTANFIDSGGLVTQFTFSVPEQLSLEDVPTPTGTNVPLVNVPGFYESQVFNVVQAGTTDARFCVGGPDPREGAKYKARYLNLRELSNTGSCGDLSHLDIVIPPWIRGFKGKFDGVLGVYFVIADVDSTAIFEGVVSSLPLPDALIDYTGFVNPSLKSTCSGPLAYRPGTVAYAPGDPLGLIGEPVARWSTAQCDPPASLTRRSTIVYDVRVDGKYFDEKLHLLQQFDVLARTINESRECLANPVVKAMAAWLGVATAKFALRRYNDSVNALEQIAFIAKAQLDAGNFAGCGPIQNVGGALMARALSLSFTVWDRWKFATAPWQLYRIPAELEIPLLISDADD